MTTAVDAPIPADGAAAARQRVPSARPGPRRRLFAKYAAALVGLVSLVLLINGSLNLWFSYNEATDAAVRLQREKAVAAAQRIEEYIAEIEKQIGWTTATQWATAPIEQRRFDFGRLQRQVPAITELIQLDNRGQEQLKVSRLAMDVVGGSADYAADPRFTGVQGKKVWFGPVYFRKESEPYMTMAVAHSGRNAGVTVAEVNLKLIWDVITAIKIGKTGYAYVVDDKGRLIAHPDISRVLRNTELSGLPQVEAARDPSTAGADPAAIVRNLDGHRVLSASAAIPKLGWLVFVEQPLSEALAPLFTSVLQTGLLLVLGLAVAILAGLLLARRMTGPIRALDTGAARIGAGALDHRIVVRTGDELEELAERFNTMAGDLQSSYADLEKKVEDRTAELKESLDQQTATAEVLGVINSSPSDLTPVFSAILEKAHGLCGITFGTLQLYDGEKLRAVATRGFPEPQEKVIREPYAPDLNSPLQGLIDGGRFVQFPDLAERDTQVPNPRSRVAVDLGIRTLLFLPLRKDSRLLGLISAARKDAKVFSEREIALLENFAAQAVIAMENARLITETREALEQQTATAEVLGIISSSPGRLEPVFDAMLANAVRICGGKSGMLALADGGGFRGVAVQGVGTEFMATLSRIHHPPPETGLDLLLKTRQTTHIADCAASPAYDPVHAFNPAFATVRTALHVPMLKESELLGAILIYRDQVLPFGDRQVELVENFAKQAVIAIENTRLITETREALEQQTATAEVLQVINSSPGNLAPVFDAMLDKATRLCEAAFGTLFTYDGECFHAVALRGVPAVFAELLDAPVHPDPGASLYRIARGEPFAHFEDVANEAAFRGPAGRALVELGGARSTLAVPLRKDDALLGAFAVYRQEVRPFSDKQIALLQNFAAQAVIAMENARLITETREALEQQTATAEVLGVINSSPGDLAPVFDTVLEKAMRLCEAAFGLLMTFDDDVFWPAAHRGLPPRFAEYVKTAEPGGWRGAHMRLSEGADFVHIVDAEDDDSYRTLPSRRALVDLGGARSVLLVPLRKDGSLLGSIAIYRQEVRPFSDKQIALLQNFAAQAVIAMENARLITETREALDQQTATAEVLGVINSSPGDLAPVFDAMLEKATSLCEAAFGVLLTWDGEGFRRAAWVGAPGALIDATRDETLTPVADSLAERFVRGEKVISVDDLVEDERYRHGAGVQALVRLGGARSYVGVALRKDDSLLGVIAIYRQEVRPFSDKQIALLQNFATQAVIAMENARLITETREALDQQTATAEVLGVINSSPGDLAPVFDAILDKAQRVCGVDHAALELYDGERFHAVAVHGASARFAETLRHGYRATESPAGRALLEGQRFAQITDAAQIDHIAFRTAAEVDGVRTVLFVPLRRDEALLGMIASARREVRPFSEKEITLLENFAAQAVIAMENARLITELRQRTGDLQESLEYQTATSEVLKVISQSGADLEPVLETLVETAARLSEAEQGYVYRLREGRHHLLASFGLAAEFKDFMLQNPIGIDRGSLSGRTLLERRVVHIEDAATDPEYTWTEAQQRGNLHTGLGVPLLREDTLVGVLGLFRSRVERFTEKQIALVTTFADQAVIAIENARLFNELRARTAELGRSVDELQMLSEVGQAVSSTLDLRAVLSTILTRSVTLTGADAGAIYRYSRAERSFRLAEAVGWDASLLHSIGDLHILENETAMGEATARRAPVQLADLVQRPSGPLRDVSLAAGFRGALIVPLVGPERVLGALVLQRRAAGEFSAETVQLMQTLASQSVLAIQNARLFREIADKSEQLALASQHKSQFLANMSHELRTPLNAILGYAELLVDGIYGVLPDRPKGVLERVQSNGRHLLALINDVLDLAKIEAGQLTLTLEDYSLPEVVRSVVTATEPLATGKGLKFTAALQEDMPKGHGDARRLSQVLLNLVGNAIKFTDAGEVEIRGSADRGQFVLEVHDTGPGIPDADQERIFGEFQQIDNSNTRQKGGTGLGLAISKRMVEMQGGTIAVESALGQGSTFRVVLPVHVDEMMEAA